MSTLALVKKGVSSISLNVFVLHHSRNNKRRVSFPANPPLI